MQGNITLVSEPDPGGQAGAACYTSGTPPLAGPVQTCYQYDTLEHLTEVKMPRNNGTQTRTWVYNLTTTNLTSETQPESGQTSYLYTNDLVNTKTDAVGNHTYYTYMRTAAELLSRAVPRAVPRTIRVRAATISMT